MRKVFGALVILWTVCAMAVLADAAARTRVINLDFSCALASAGTACLGDYPIAGGAWDGSETAVALIDGDRAKVTVKTGSTAQVAWYVFDADDAGADGTGDLPDQVRGGGYSSAGLWILASVTQKSYTSSASATPSLILKDSDNAAGTAEIYGKSDGGVNAIVMTIGVEDSVGENQSYIEVNGTNKQVTIVKPLIATMEEYAEITDGTLTAAKVSRSLITNEGIANGPGTITKTLPAASKGETFIAMVTTVTTGSRVWKFLRGGSDTITWSSGGTDTTGKTYFQATDQPEGSRVSCITYYTGGVYKWLCGVVTGTWVTD